MWGREVNSEVEIIIFLDGFETNKNSIVSKVAVKRNSLVSTG